MDKENQRKVTGPVRGSGTRSALGHRVHLTCIEHNTIPCVNSVAPPQSAPEAQWQAKFRADKFVDG
jgi:hypothetical protein